MSKNAFVIQSGGNINETPAEQMDLVIIKLGIVSKNILYILNHVLYVILQQLMSITWANDYIIALGLWGTFLLVDKGFYWDKINVASVKWLLFLKNHNGYLWWAGIKHLAFIIVLQSRHFTEEETELTEIKWSLHY